LVLRRVGALGTGLTSSDGQFARRSGYFDPAMQQQQTKGAIVVFLPRPDAQVWIDSFQTQQQGTERTFETPPLQQAGTYKVKATWTENGNTVTREQPARVQAGRWTTVEFRTGDQQNNNQPTNQPANQRNQQSSPERVPGGQINQQQQNNADQPINDRQTD